MDDTLHVNFTFAKISIFTVLYLSTCDARVFNQTCHDFSHGMTKIASMGCKVNIVDRGKAEVDIGFRGVTISKLKSTLLFSQYTLRFSQYLLYYTEYYLNTSSTLRLVSKQSSSSEYLSLYSVLRKFKRIYDASQNLW